MGHLSEGRAQLNAERALLRQSVAHHCRREAELERQLASLLALASHGPHCKCETAKAARHLAAELEE